MRHHHPPSLSIRPFQPADQAAVKKLILAGLVEHWGTLDTSKNPDLNDIASSYANGVFLVAWQQERIAGTGAFLPRAGGTAEVVRMSVAADMRRLGVGGTILGELLRQAKARGYNRIILETTETWSEVIEFYLSQGFQITHHLNGDVYFKLDL